MRLELSFKFCGYYIVIIDLAYESRCTLNYVDLLSFGECSKWQWTTFYYNEGNLIIFNKRLSK